MFAGIDVGQSSTAAVIGDGRRIAGRGEAGPGDEIGQGASSTRLRDAVEGALASALRDAGLPDDTRFEAIVAGISGYEGALAGAAPRLPSRRVELMHDAPIAHAGALAGEPGVVVIAGTGSVAYTRARDGRTRTVGGWGYLFGDQGSAFWIARTAFELAIDHDAECAAQIAAFFGEPDLRRTARAFYEGRIARERFAALAAYCVEAAQTPGACGCLSDPVGAAARELARLAQQALIDPPGQTAVAFTGGLMRSSWFAGLVRATAHERLGACAIVEPVASPAEGALLLAARL